MSKLFQDPLVHFLLIGGVLFWFGHTPNQPIAPSIEEGEQVEQSRSITITRDVADELWNAHAEIRGRELTKREKAEFIQRFRDEEILVQEALQLNLHQHDNSIRQRLIDKMRFLFVGLLPDPPLSDLRTFYESNPEKYVLSASISVEHVLVSREQIKDAQKNRTGSRQAEKRSSN